MRLRKKTVPNFIPDSTKFIGLRREEVPDEDCLEAAAEIERLRSLNASLFEETRERAAKVADMRAEVAAAAARCDYARLHDVTDVHEGRAAMARDIANRLRSLQQEPQT